MKNDILTTFFKSGGYMHKPEIIEHIIVMNEAGKGQKNSASVAIPSSAI